MTGYPGKDANEPVVDEEWSPPLLTENVRPSLNRKQRRLQEALRRKQGKSRSKKR